MAHITIEYVILLPMLILQIFLLPYVAGIFMNYWSTSSETLALQDASSHISSSIQQLYFFLNNPSVSSGTVTNTLGTTHYISNHAYLGNATLISVAGSGSGKVLELTLHLKGTTIATTAPIVLGQNVQWSNSSFMSNSKSACINAYKDSNNVIWLSFRT
jgi:hypothetical protein